MLLRRTALKQELLWAALFVAVVSGALVLGADGVLAAAVGLTCYASWHLVQAVRLLAFFLDDRDPGERWVWGIWREVFDRARWMKRHERKRKRRQHRVFSNFREMAAAMPDGVITLGSGGEVSWLNRQAGLYFDLKGAAVGRKLVDLVNHPVLRDYLQAGQFSQVLEVEAPGDPAVILEISLSRFKKKRDRYLLVARDITPQYHLNHTQRDFTLNVSHELRTPLTVLHGYIETLIDSEDEQSPMRRPLTRMAEQTRRMQGVIQDMTSLSRLESGAETLQIEPVSTLEMLEDIASEAQEVARDTGHELRLTGDPQLGLLGDESLLRCAFSNLVLNAIRHTPGRTQVDISWGREGDQAVLLVRDNGAGIAARHLARLTERFYRVDGSRSRDAGGTGLGLAIVRQILEMHDAQLSINSTEGRGSSFACRFPPQAIHQPGAGSSVSRRAGLPVQ
ncbi:MAG: phosphate regulon sensor histidine kinase PhoR [Sedimenticolaceae bacterium]